MVGGPLLMSIGGIVGAVDVQQEGRQRAAVLARPQIDLNQCMSQAQANRPSRGVLQAGEGGLTGQIGSTL